MLDKLLLNQTRHVSASDTIVTDQCSLSGCCCRRTSSDPSSDTHRPIYCILRGGLAPRTGECRSFGAIRGAMDATTTAHGPEMVCAVGTWRRPHQSVTGDLEFRSLPLPKIEVCHGMGGQPFVWCIFCIAIAPKFHNVEMTVLEAFGVQKNRLVRFDRLRKVRFPCFC